MLHVDVGQGRAFGAATWPTVDEAIIGPPRGAAAGGPLRWVSCASLSVAPSAPHVLVASGSLAGLWGTCVLALIVLCINHTRAPAAADPAPAQPGTTLPTNTLFPPPLPGP